MNMETDDNLDLGANISASSSEKNECLGHSMEQIYSFTNRKFKHFPNVSPSENHTVLYHLPLRNNFQPPEPQIGTLRWDSDNVRLPCAPESKYPVKGDTGEQYIENRWSIIVTAFSKKINSSVELEKAILTYNTRYSKWKFNGLHKLFEEELDEEESQSFFNKTLPKIIQLALRLPDLIRKRIPLLKQNLNKSISFSQEQCACLLANAFLCTYPRRNSDYRNSEYARYPDINFNRLYKSTAPNVIEKIKCICNYFVRVCKKMPKGVITMTRRSINYNEFPDWENCNSKIGETMLHISSTGTIEESTGLLQVDFANCYLGGGVLGQGCVQEEIRFVICPELIISKLFTERLKSNEALFMIGCERFNSYSGYASTFHWTGDYLDKTPSDDSLRKECFIVAIDALCFDGNPMDQFTLPNIRRELNKAYVGFSNSVFKPVPAVASGNWGCGAFGGEKSLKSMIQLIVCTITNRPLVYYTFGDQQFVEDFHEFYLFCKEQKITVGQLWRHLNNYYVYCKDAKTDTDLFSFIYQRHLNKIESNTSTTSIDQSHAVPSTSSTSTSVLASTSKINNINSSSFYNIFGDKSSVDVTKKFCKSNFLIKQSSDNGSDDNADDDDRTTSNNKNNKNNNNDDNNLCDKTIDTEKAVPIRNNIIDDSLSEKRPLTLLEQLELELYPEEAINSGGPSKKKKQFIPYNQMTVQNVNLNVEDDDEGEHQLLSISSSIEQKSFNLIKNSRLPINSSEGIIMDSELKIDSSIINETDGDVDDEIIPCTPPPPPPPPATATPSLDRKKQMNLFNYFKSK